MRPEPSSHRQMLRTTIEIAGIALAALAMGMAATWIIANYWPWLIALAVVAFVFIVAAAVIADQAKREAAEREARLAKIANLRRVDAMSGNEFEHLVAELLRRDGWRSVLVVGKAGDRGIDITAHDHTGRLYAFQCKRQAAKVGADRVRNLIGAVHSTYRGHHGVLVTSSYYTRNALDEALGHITLIDRDTLEKWMRTGPLRL